MNIYNLVLCLLVLLSLTEIIALSSLSSTIAIVKAGRKSSAITLKQIAVLLLTTGLAMLSAARDISVGLDLANYVPRYIAFGLAEWADLFDLAEYYTFEKGFAIFCKLLYLVNPNPGFFLAITSIIIGLGFYQLSRFSKMPITTVFIVFSFGFYGASMNIVRQYLAFSILMFGVKFIFERKLFSYLLVIAFAMSFHRMSVLFVVLYFLYSFPFNTKWFLAVVFAGVFLLLFCEPLIRIAVQGTYYERYLSRNVNGSGEKLLILLFALFCGACFFQKQILAVDNRQNLYIWGLATALMLNFMALKFALVARAMAFFTPLTAVLVPELLYATKRSGVKIYLIFAFAVIGFYVIYFQIVILGADAISGGWYPYLLREMS